MATRAQNEKRFHFWKELPGGGLLVERHQKYPVDTGHERLWGEE
ncbi:MAG: hypothetical protein U0350_00555 [Caldilineaceae bacterium]